MKRGFLIVSLLLVSAFFLSGLGCTSSKETIVIDDNTNEVQAPAVKILSSSILVDRTIKLDGANPPFDLSTKTFTQKEGKGFRVEIVANDEVKVELTDAKGCLSKSQGTSYNAILAKTGKEVSFDYTEATSEDIIQCVAIQSLGSDIDLTLKIYELTF